MTTKLAMTIGAMLVLAACTTGLPTSSPRPQETATSTAAAPTAAAPTATAPTAATSTAAVSTETASQSEAPANSPRASSAEADGSSDAGDSRDKEAEAADGEDEKEAETKPDAESRPGRVVLKTAYDDRDVGDDQSKAIEAELGLVQNEALLEYVQSVGIRLVRHAPLQPFDYQFQIVDQSVPNAFALPGGRIYVSRGLLALVESEDELAGVLGHEITHAAERHSAARIDYSSRLNPFSIGFLRAAAIAAYSRDQERDADRGGQILAAKAGYDPAGIARFLRKLDASERYEVGWSRLPYFLATHPTSPQRSALASDRAAKIPWERQRGVAEHLPNAYYSMIDGLILGDNPAGGLFDEGRFVHPDLGFSIRFPKGWTTMNSQDAVAAISPLRDAEASLTVVGRGDSLEDIEKTVDEFIKREVDGIRVRIRERRRVQIGDRPAIRIEGSASTGLVGLSHQMTFVAHGGLIYRLSMLSVSSTAAKYRGRGRAFAHSFRPLDEAGTRSLSVTRLRIARALENETLQALAERTRNDLELVFTGVLNDLYASTRLAKGTPVKIGLAEPYLLSPKEPTPEETNDEGERETDSRPETSEREDAVAP